MWWYTTEHGALDSSYQKDRTVRGRGPHFAAGRRPPHPPQIIDCDSHGFFSLTGGTASEAKQNTAGIEKDCETSQKTRRSTVHAWEVVKCHGPDCPATRSGHTMVVMGSHSHEAILFGGLGVKDVLGDTWCLDLSSMAWNRCGMSSSPYRPVPRYGHTAVYIEGVGMCVYGGVVSASEMRCTGEVAVLQGSSSSWSSRCQSYARWGHTAVVYGEVFGEQSAVTGKAVLHEDPVSWMIVALGESGDDQQRIPAVSAYSPERNQWHEVTTHGERPTPRRRHQAVLYENTTMYLFGGRHDMTTLNDTYSLNLKTRIWTRLAVHVLGPTLPSPSPRTGHSAVCVNGFMYTFGGFEMRHDEVTGGTVFAVHNDVHSFDLCNHQWRRITPATPHPSAKSTTVRGLRSRLPPQMSMSASFFFQGKLFVHGGRDLVPTVFGELTALPLSGDLFTRTQGIVSSLRHLVAQYMVDHDLVFVVPPHLRKTLDAMFHSK